MIREKYLARFCPSTFGNPEDLKVFLIEKLPPLSYLRYIFSIKLFFELKLNDLKAIFFDFHWRPKSLTFGFENTGGDNLNFSSGIFFFVFVPFFQNQSVALIYLKIGKTQFQLFLAGNDFVKIFSPNFFVDYCHS